jgi:rubrerythrin
MSGAPDDDDEIVQWDEVLEELMADESPGGFKDLGITPLAKQLGLSPEQTNGHWCSRCQGIWFGYTLETQCPVCGNRRG